MRSAWLAILACGCSTDAPQTVPADEWLGRWNGPEGTYLEIAGENGSYAITVKDLDAARTFAGSSAGDAIEFRRDQVLEVLRPTNGDETGMKWLAGKMNCLTIRRGEGFCRD